MEAVAPDKEIVELIEQARGDTYRLCFQCGLCDVVCPWNRVCGFSMRGLLREAAFGLSRIGVSVEFPVIGDTLSITLDYSYSLITETTILDLGWAFQF